MGLFRREAEPPAEPEGQEVVVVVDQAVDPHLVMFHDPHSQEAEQYRGLRNQIVAMNRERAPRSLVLTSAMAGEGKSITTLNLGMALGELRDTRVVALDADLRRPSLEGLLGLDRRRGLADVLSGRYAPDRAIQRTPHANLSLIGAGATPSNPAELVAADRASVLIHALKENFNYVLIDAPPVLDLTDATVLAHAVDGVLLVVRLEYTPRRDVERAIEMIRNVGANLLGIFLVGARSDRRRTGYHSSYLAGRGA
ncbi:MAG: CpsD/CapB family tyrosine-protein kinase [Planctomycetes bacterium]|nr:CpsD/CapB family tyrosine-protein kinase [Planctomycetota bacterium]